jgi:predicted HicB family RNase H-like nuclease
MIEYKGYFAKIEFDDDADIFHGEVIKLRDVITFEGESVKEIKQAFHDSVDDYLEFCAERGEHPEISNDNEFIFPLPSEFHKDIAINTREKGKSLTNSIFA